MQGDLERVLFDEPTILRRLDQIAAQISTDYRDCELTVIAVLNGSLMFMADLLQRIPLPLKLDCLSVANYHRKAQTSGEVIFKQLAPLLSLRKGEGRVRVQHFCEKHRDSSPLNPLPFLEGRGGHSG